MVDVKFTAGVRYVRCEASWVSPIWVRLSGDVGQSWRLLCQRNSWKNTDYGMFYFTIVLQYGSFSHDKCTILGFTEPHMLTNYFII